MVQMGDGNELDVQSAAAFAKPGEVLSYWQLQVNLNTRGLGMLESWSCKNPPLSTSSCACNVERKQPVQRCQAVPICIQCF